MKLKKLIIPLTLALSISSSVFASAADGELIALNGGRNYVKQYMTNWCWAATGVNIFIAIDEDNPLRGNEKDALINFVEDFINNSDRLSPENGSYDIAAGLTDTAQIATDLLHDNGYDGLYYEVAKDSSGKKVIRTFKFLMGDLKYGCPSGAWLTPLDQEKGFNHIVLINGADSAFSSSKQYEIRFFNSEDGTNNWVPYNDFVSGQTKITNNKKYDGTCEFYGGF